MAVAVAAMVCVLSVFNGFRSVIADRLGSLTPDVAVTPVAGKTFAAGDSIAKVIEAVPGVAAATPTLTEQALLVNGQAEMPVTVRGVDFNDYARVTSIVAVTDTAAGSFYPDPASQPSPRTDSKAHATAVAAVGPATRLGIYPASEVFVLVPRREGRLNPANPLASFRTDSLAVTGIYRTDQAVYDDDGLIVPLETARRLLGYDREASAVEVKAREGVDPVALAGRISRVLGPGYSVRDRNAQQQESFRMVNVEKWVSFLLLGFILLIASFNMISSMAMLVLEKDKWFGALRAMGMTRRRIGSVFAIESAFVTAIGACAGLLLGVALCLLQEHFGIIKLGGDAGAMIVEAYPVKLQPCDLLWTLLPIMLTGGLTAAVTAAWATSRVKI